MRCLVILAIFVVAGVLPSQANLLPVKLVPRARIRLQRGGIGALDVHQASKRLVSGGARGDLVLQTHPGGEVLWQRQASDHWFKAVRFSPNGQMIAAAGRTVSVWSRAGLKLHEWSNSTEVSNLAWSPDGSLLAFTAGPSRGLVVAATGTWTVKQRFPIAGQPGDFRFSSDGKRLIAGDVSGAVCTIDLATGKGARVDPKAGVTKDDQLRHLAWFGDNLVQAFWKGSVRWGDTHVHHGKYLYAMAAHGNRVLSSNSSSVRSWNRNGELIGKLPFGAIAMRFEPDGESVLLATVDHRLVRWDFEKVEELRNPHPSDVGHLAFSRDSNYVVAASSDGKSIVRCEIRTGVSKSCKSGFPVCPGAAGSEVLSQTSGRYAFRDGATWEVLRRVGKTPADNSFSPRVETSLAPDGKTILIGEYFFDVESGKSKKVDHPFVSSGIRWSSKGHVVTSYRIGIDSGSGIRVFNAARKLVFEIEFPSFAGCASSGISSYDFAPSGDVLTYVEWRSDRPSSIQRIGLAPVGEIDEVQAPITWWRYLEEDLALANAPTGMELWDAKRMEQLGVLDPELGGLARLVLSPDRRWLAAVFPLHVRIYEVRR